MNWQRFEAAFQDLQERKLELLRKKNSDYASREDVFWNFGQIAELAGVTLEQTFLVFLACKLARLGNLLKSSKEPQNESIEDSLVDLSNYADLLAVFKMGQESDGQHS